MTKEEFYKRFNELVSGMVQLAFEYVGRNADEVDTVFVYVDMEAGNDFFNVFYRVNGTLVEMHKVNDHLQQQVDTSMGRMGEVLHTGMHDTEKMRALFDAFQGKVPTVMRMMFHPKTGKFDNDIRYELFHSNNNDIDSAEVFRAWRDTHRP